MPRTIALVYLAFGAVWIFFTDRLLVWLGLPPDIIAKTSAKYAEALQRLTAEV